LDERFVEGGGGGGNWDRWNYIGGLGLVWPIGTEDKTSGNCFEVKLVGD